MYIPQIGDVIKDKDKEHLVVVVAIKNYETVGSCSYDRKYLLCDLDYLAKNQGIISTSDLELHGRWVPIWGTKFPEIEKVDVIPFFIEDIECRVVKRKKAK